MTIGFVNMCLRTGCWRTRRWLDGRNFFGVTGMKHDHLRFCRGRHEKAEHALALSLTHFIDDRIDVLQHLEGIVPNRFPIRSAASTVSDWSDADSCSRLAGASARHQGNVMNRGDACLVSHTPLALR
jgi:hypothetical protein